MSETVVPILVWGAVIPAVVALVGLALALRPGSTEKARAPGAAGIVLGGACLIGHLGFPGAPGPTSGDVGWLLPLFAFAAGVLGFALARWTLPAAARYILRGAPALAFALLLVQPRLAGGMTQRHAAAIIALSSAAMLVAWFVVERAARAEPGPSLAVALLVWGAGGSAALVMSGTALVGQMAGILLAALGATLLVVWKWPDTGQLASAAGVVALTFVGQWTYAALYASMSWLIYGLLVLSVAGLLATRLPPLRHKTGIAPFAVRIGALAASLALPLGLAATNYFGDSAADAPYGTEPSGIDEPSYDEDYGY